MRPSARQWLHLALVILLALGIAALAQAIAERHPLRVDLTANRAHSLSEVSRNVLEMLPDPIRATLFYDRSERQKAADLMELFRGAAPNFHYELLDLDRFPGRAREEGIEKYGKAVLRYHDQKVVVDALHEQNVSAGLLRLARGRPTLVRFLEGHGERDLAEVSQPTGYGQLRMALVQENYEVSALSLLREDEVPADVDLLVIAGPKNDLLEAEIEAIARYLERGGHLIALIDPVPLPNLQRLLGRWGIEASLDIVVDRSNRVLGSDPFTVPVPRFRPHPIVSSSRTPALFPVARSIDASGAGEDGGDAAVVAETYPDAWSIRDFERAANPGIPPREGEDRSGPIPVMAAAERKTAEGAEARAVAVGDSDFAANGFLDLLGNRDLVLSAIGWSVAVEALVASRPASQTEALRPLSPMVLTRNQGRALFFGLVLVEPALVLGLGLAVALRRRWRG